MSIRPSNIILTLVLIAGLPIGFAAAATVVHPTNTVVLTVPLHQTATAAIAIDNPQREWVPAKARASIRHVRIKGWIVDSPERVPDIKRANLTKTFYPYRHSLKSSFVRYLPRDPPLT